MKRHCPLGTMPFGDRAMKRGLAIGPEPFPVLKQSQTKDSCSKHQDSSRLWDICCPNIAAAIGDAAGHSCHIDTQVISAWAEIEAAFAEIRVAPGLVERHCSSLSSIEGIVDSGGCHHICPIHIQLVPISDHQSISEINPHRRRCRELITI